MYCEMYFPQCKMYCKCNFRMYCWMYFEKQCKMHNIPVFIPPSFAALKHYFSLLNISPKVARQQKHSIGRKERYIQPMCNEYLLWNVQCLLHFIASRFYTRRCVKLRQKIASGQNSVNLQHNLSCMYSIHSIHCILWVRSHISSKIVHSV